MKRMNFLDSIRRLIEGWSMGMPFSVFDFYARLSLMLVTCLIMLKWGFFVLGNRVVAIQAIFGVLGLLIGLLVPLPIHALYDSVRLPLIIVFIITILTIPVFLPRYLTGRYVLYKLISKRVFVSIALLFVINAALY